MATGPASLVWCASRRRILGGAPLRQRPESRDRPGRGLGEFSLSARHQLDE